MMMMKNDMNNYESRFSMSKKSLYILSGLIILLLITLLALAAAILGVVVHRLDGKNSTSSERSASSLFVDQIKIDDLMKHLQQLQVFADRSNGTRAIATSGFNDTLDYITEQLRQNTNLIVQPQHFTVRNYVIRDTPQLQSRINGNVSNHSYVTDFTQILFSSRANFVDFVRVVYIPNFGCSDADWAGASVTNLVALVERGDCPYIQKSALAEKYQVQGLLIYNDASGMTPLQNVRNNLNTTIPAFFISYTLGSQLANAASTAEVLMNIDVIDAEGVGNICADTPTGDKTKTIVIGSHSDSVPAGSGINDNGKIFSIS